MREKVILVCTECLSRNYSVIMYTINNNDIDINGDSPSKLYNGKYITKYIGIPISEVKYN